ncbi:MULTISPECIES: anti-sigma factor domain-containing protein [Pontibacillus]|uniref:Anti-sigma factor domain-containing protein n=1 Tax=Pontibacillus chungwhensis TaxID=265426 RepID=A0ABY8V211_9BACI|nr:MULTISPECIES: anti-sigma factor domain-containing protein [Pontibacillus]MCD5324846.1 anti-sigma factor domain-containing protein [Pontibacillus sp. HN14]WIF98804.1 anti-sigma factor domain-containing protein [Pontibacillus chungwhensis]
MKKGVVMEQHRRYTIVMTSEGTFYKAKAIQSSMPGDEVSFEPLPERKGFGSLFPNTLKPNVRFVAMVAALLIAILPLYSWIDSNRAYAYVNIEMNPSIEMKVNDKMKVIEMMPLNDDASIIVEKITDWKNKAVEKVTITVIETGKEIGLINENKSVMIGVSHESTVRQEEDVLQTIDRYLQSHSVSGMNIATFAVPKSIREKAESDGKSMNETLAESYQLSRAGNVVSGKTNQMSENEAEAFNNFYNKAQVEAPDSSSDEEAPQEKKPEPSSKDEKQQENEQPKESSEPQTKKDIQPSSPSTNPVNPAGKEKGWAKQGKEKEDPPGQSRGLPSGLSSKQQEIIQHLPPGLQKKVQSYDNWNELPPGIQKQILSIYQSLNDYEQELKKNKPQGNGKEKEHQKQKHWNKEKNDKKYQDHKHDKHKDKKHRDDKHKEKKHKHDD